MRERGGAGGSIFFFSSAGLARLAGPRCSISRTSQGGVAEGRGGGGGGGGAGGGGGGR